MPKPVSELNPAEQEQIIRLTAESLLQSYLTNVQKQFSAAIGRPKRASEAIHQVRVYSRRASEALEIFSELLPKRQRKWFRKQLSRVRRMTGRLRDLDVLYLRFSHRKDESHKTKKEDTELIKIIRRQRRSERRPLELLYNKLVRTQLFAKRKRKLLEEIGVRSQPMIIDVSYHDFARHKLAAVAEDFFAAGRTPLNDQKTVHRFRRRTKKLRYALEILSGALPADFLHNADEVISMLQERLGSINDCAVAIELIDEWSKQTGGKRAEKFESQRNSEHARMQELLLSLEDCWNSRSAESLQEIFSRQLSS